MSKVTGLKAGPGFIERCAHSFTPADCPYEECGYRDALDEIERLTAELAAVQEDTARLGFLISWLNRESQYGVCVNRWHPTKRTTLLWGSDAEWRGLLDAARKESR